jgi:DNA-binding NarL/FixJ family response regulator
VARTDAPCTGSAVEAYATTHHFTVRELQIFSLALDGLTDKAIASALEVSDSTIRAHWRHICSKLRCSGQRDAIRHFARTMLATRALVT